jgi:hypothetical protein
MVLTDSGMIELLWGTGGLGGFGLNVLITPPKAYTRHMTVLEYMIAHEHKKVQKRLESH